MKISVVGAGYVGLTTAVGLAKLGHIVKVIDVDKDKIIKINKGMPPIYEDGISDLLSFLVPRKLEATVSYKKGITLFQPDIVFICVGTPSNPDGSINLEYLKIALKDIAKSISNIKKYVVIVIKSTVTPTTTERIAINILEKESKKVAGRDFGIVMNPEFLREGKALDDFLNPDRIVIGYKFERDLNILKEAYKGINKPILEVSLSTAEMIKYASNAFLATKISFINEIGNICKRLNIDVYDVAEGMGLDHRISPYFLNAGIGFGGSCFPKDLKALVNLSKEKDYSPVLLESVIQVNEKQPIELVNLALKKLGTLRGKRITVLGLSFKPGTDDMREAPSVKVINKLLELGATIVAYDPVAMNNARRIFGKKIEYAESLGDAISRSKIIFILTEWNQFRDESIYRGKIVFDGRRVLNPQSAKKICDYEGICW